MTDRARLIVAFCGRAGAGKSTAARRLVEAHGFARVSFMGPAKAMLRALGLTDREIDGDLKEVPCDKLRGRTPRHAQLTLGTDWRLTIDPDLWLAHWHAGVDAVPAFAPIVVDDMRMPAEAEAVRSRGGVLVRVVRQVPGLVPRTHATEAHAGTLPAMVNIENLGSLGDLDARVDDLAAALRKALAS